MDHAKEIWMIGIMVSVTIVKFVLMVYCRRFKNEIVRAYAQDHLFDVITNSVGLAAAVLAVRFYWWMDPTGAIIVSSLLGPSYYSFSSSRYVSVPCKLYIYIYFFLIFLLCHKQ